MVFDAHGFRPEATSCYLTAAGLNGDDYRWPYLYAQLLVVDDPIGAIDAFRLAHAINPADPTVSLRAGDVLLEAGQLASARSQFQATLSHPQASPYGHFGIARLDLLDQRLDQASDHLEAAVAARWEFRQAHALLAEIYQREGDEESAQIHRWAAARGKAIEPADPVRDEMADHGVTAEWKKKKGLGLQNRGRLDEAEAQLRAAVSLAPNDLSHLVNLANLLAQKKDLAQAMEVCNDAEKLNPQSQLAQNLSGRIAYLAGDQLLARKHYEKTLEIDQTHVPEAVDAHYFLAALSFDRGQGPESRDHLLRAVELNPGHVRSLIRLGNLLLEEGNQGGAADLWLRAVRIDPTRADFALRLATLLSGRRETKRAIEVLRIARSQAPDHQRLSMLLAWQLATAEDAEDRNPTEALSLAQATYSREPASVQTAEILAAALASSGQFKKATEVILGAVRLAESSDQHHLIQTLQSRAELYRSGKPYRQ
jgi:tetratricopeptide (TPR) repeat protein